MPVQAGQLVHVRSRRYLVESVDLRDRPGDDTLVRLSCVDDDAQGHTLEVLWEHEVDAQILDEKGWRFAADRGLDPARRFAAYLNAVRWNCVTAADPRLLQAPYRAGIDLKAYQLEPLRKALLLPRVNLFIADDVGLGKTIEAALILREMLLRQRVDRIVVAAPPSVVEQWRAELDIRFGLSMQIFDRDFVMRCRRERGWGINPWTTKSRFIISHALLRDESYASSLRDWLGGAEPCPRTMLVLDEAHHAAPASGARYAIDSQFTRTLRDLAPHFEHRLFLSATPHNGHSNSFSALLEVLDPQRFCRGVPIHGPKALEAVMVRRLKSDLRSQGVSVPLRKVIQIDIEGLPDDAPELVLAQLLDEYRSLREVKLERAKKSTRAAGLLVITALQKRLLSSVNAFAATLNVHRRALARQLDSSTPTDRLPQLPLLTGAPGPDDDAGDLTEDELTEEEAVQVEVATSVGASDPAAALDAKATELLERMTQIAEAARHHPDARVKHLVAWLRENCFTKGKWNDRRVLIFTEYVDTLRYLRDRLAEAFAETDLADDRIAAFHGGMFGNDAHREEIKAAFNQDPKRYPLRILIATDAAREGVNLQNHCADLFHFDVPWNPSRMEQRNGRIDRTLQRAVEVRCHYFVYTQRPEDRVLQVLVEKAKNIQEELGSLSPILEQRLANSLADGIRRDDVDALAERVRTASVGDKSEVVVEELEPSRDRSAALAAQIDQLRGLLEISERHMHFGASHLRTAIDEALALSGREPLAPAGRKGDLDLYRFPDFATHGDLSWNETLDSLRQPRTREQTFWEWRKTAPLRPVSFRDTGSLDDDVVQLHLEQRIVRRLLGRFLAQGFAHEDLSRVCAFLTDHPRPRVILLGRLSLHGSGGSRLHDDIVAITAAWVEPAARKGPLKPYAATAEAETLTFLDSALADPSLASVSQSQAALLACSAEEDGKELLPELGKRSDLLAHEAKERLRQRAEKEKRDMLELLRSQQKRLSEVVNEKLAQLTLDFSPEERRQLEAERRHQNQRLVAIERELVSEPARIGAVYEVQAQRLDPLGLIYLWPRTG